MIFENFEARIRNSKESTGMLDIKKTIVVPAALFWALAALLLGPVGSDFGSGSGRGCCLAAAV